MHKKSEKNHAIAGYNFLNESQMLYQLSGGFQRNVAQIFSTPSPSTHFTEQMEACMNSQ